MLIHSEVVKESTRNYRVHEDVGGVWAMHSGLDVKQDYCYHSIVNAWLHSPADHSGSHVPPLI